MRGRAQCGFAGPPRRPGPPFLWSVVATQYRTPSLDSRDVREGREGLFVDEVGGEWEREGLGQGLEERLESLMNMNQVGQVTSKA